MGDLGFDALEERRPSFKNTGRTWLKPGQRPWNTLMEHEHGGFVLQYAK